MVTEKRFYTSWVESDTPSNSEINSSQGIIKAKKLLNTLHRDLAEEGYNEIYVDQVTEEIVAVTRHCPTHHKSYILLAHTSFHTPPEWLTPTVNRPNTGFNNVPPLTVHGKIKVIIFLLINYVIYIII